MANAARLALAARRNEVARITIAVKGIDLTGVTMAMQVRLRPDTPGAPQFALATVSTLAAEGIKLDGVTVTDGVPTSIIKVRINASTMTDAAKVPYAGEVGTDTPMAYAMQWTLNGDAQTRLYGDFLVEASAFGSDSAPTNRPIGYGGAQQASAGDTGSLSFGDQVVRVSLDGVEALAPLLGAATEAAENATSAAAAIEASLASVQELLYASPIDFNPNGASDTGDGAATDNATLFIDGTFGDVFGSEPTLITSVVQYASAAIASFKAKRWVVNGDGTVSGGQVIYSGPLVDGQNVLPVEGFIAEPNGTLSGWSASGNLCRRTGTGSGSGPYVPGDTTGDNLARIPAGFTLMMSATGRQGSVSEALADLQAQVGKPFYRFWSFYEDPNAPPARDTGQLSVLEGTDGINFPLLRPVVYPGMPAGEYARDPSVFRDEERGLEFIAHSSHAFGTGAGGAIFTVAFARPAATGPIMVNYLASINVAALTGGNYNSAWAPEWVVAPNDPVRLLVSCNYGAGHKPLLLQSTDYMHRSFAYMAPLTGTQIPTSCIDGQITCIGGRYVLIAKNETSFTLFAAQSTGDVTGPYDTPIALGFTDTPIEGPQLLSLPAGRVRLYADKYAGERMGARDADYLGAAWGSTVPLNSYGQAPMLHGTVLRITGTR